MEWTLRNAPIPTSCGDAFASSAYLLACTHCTLWAGLAIRLIIFARGEITHATPLLIASIFLHLGGDTRDN